VAVCAEVGRAPAPRRRRRWLLLATVTVACAVVLAAGWFVWIAPDPLSASGPATGSGQLYVGTRVDHDGVNGVTYVTVPGGRLVFDFTLENRGDLPLTVTGLSGSLATVAERQDPWFDRVILSPAASADDGASRRFTIPAHSSIDARLTIYLRNCLDWPATPTLPPGRPPSAEDASALAEAFGWNGISDVEVAYNAAGLDLVGNVVLPARMDIVAADRGGCSSAPITVPSGLHVTPEPSFAFAS
jgi:hypothetical protein